MPNNTRMGCHAQNYTGAKCCGVDNVAWTPEDEHASAWLGHQPNLN